MSSDTSGQQTFTGRVWSLSADVYALEQATLFHGEWFFVGRGDPGAAAVG